MLGYIAYMFVYRRVHGVGNTYSKIYEKPITSLDDLNVTEKDIISNSGATYDYYIELADSNTSEYNVLEFDTVSNVESWFQGLFVGNYEKQYVAHLSCSTSVTRNTESKYVTTLLGRTPYVVSNSNLNYSTGSSQGLFSRLDNNNQPIAELTDEYRNEVVDFLTDGTDKILKTSTGGIWLVSIDPQINIEPDDNYLGFNIISFDWTEIDDVPILKKVTS